MVKYATMENKRRLGTQDEMPKTVLFLCLFSLEMEPPAPLSIQRKLDKNKDIVAYDILTCAMFPKTRCMFSCISYYSPSHVHDMGIH